MNLKSQFPSAWRTKHLYQWQNTFISWCIAKHSQFRLSFNLLPEHFFWFWKPGGNTILRGPQEWELLSNSVKLHTTSSSATSMWDQHPPTALLDLLSPKPTRCIWEHYGCPPYYKRFCREFVLSQRPSLLGVGRLRDLLLAPSATCTTLWHTGDKNSHKAPNWRHAHCLLRTRL